MARLAAALLAFPLSALALRAPRLPLAVIVDVDDTVKSSGNVRLFDIPLGGIDGQYERGAFYPGVGDFCVELALASGAAPEPVSVLTARAEEFKFALELNAGDKVVKRFRAVGDQRGLGDWGVAYDRVLYGSVHEWVFQDFKGWRKFANFEKLLARLGDAGAEASRSYVFVGDTGELDGQAGELMAARYGDRVAAVLLHAVGTDPSGSCAVPAGYDVGGVPVRFFRTYVGAAAVARDLGLLDGAAVERVVAAARADLDAGDAGDARNRRADVEADIAAAAASRGVR